MPATQLQLRDQILSGFLHVPRSSISVMLRMCRAINATHAQVSSGVAQLVKDGLLLKTSREGRLPPLFTPAASLHLNGAQEQFVVLRKLSLYEQKSLEEAIRDEHKYALDQQNVLGFLEQRGDLGASTFMLQDLLRSNTTQDNYVDTNTVLAQLAWNGEIIGSCNQMIWHFLERKTTHVWD